MDEETLIQHLKTIYIRQPVDLHEPLDARGFTIICQAPCIFHQSVVTSEVFYDGDDNAPVFHRSHRRCWGIFDNIDQIKNKRWQIQQQLGIPVDND